MGAISKATWLEGWILGTAMVQDATPEVIAAEIAYSMDPRNTRDERTYGYVAALTAAMGGRQ